MSQFPHERALSSPGISASQRRVAIVGGGLAGLAAAAALVERGFEVEIFEARRKLGGRAGSYIDRETDESIDHCQHVAMGCCTNFLDFCRRAGIADLFLHHETLYFLGPGGERCEFRPSPRWPAPLHLIRPLWNLKYLSLADKISIAGAMLPLIYVSRVDDPIGPTVAAWLQEQRQSPSAIDGFWKVVLVSALGESLNRASLAAARKVIVDGFLASPEASRVIVPRVSLGELYDQCVAGWLRSKGVKIRLETPIAAIAAQGMRAVGVRLTSGVEERFDHVIVAAPWHRLGSLLAPELMKIVDPGGRIASIQSSPIASVHLWFDRPITELPHAVFVGRLSQWMFARELGAERGESYYQVVISAAHFLVEIERRSIIDEVERDLKAVFPAAAGATLLRSKLIVDQNAVFSVRPGLDLIRPQNRTAITNLYLSGDWTRTGWPATMEGAVRSGYQAAEAILAYLGQPANIVVPDLPQSWLMKELSGRG